MKVMYFMNVSWNWIKQRPHFLAEEMSRFYDLTVYDSFKWRSKNLSKNSTDKVTLRFLFVIPFCRFFIIEYLNDVLKRWQLKKKIIDYDVIWINSPNQYRLLEGRISDRQVLIYDCMDNQLEFPMIKNNIKKLKYFLRLEEELVERSDIVITSSHYLTNVLISRYNVDRTKFKVINNAIDDKKANSSKCAKEKLSVKSKNGKVKHIVYIGTISKWFDFKLVLDSLAKYKDIQYELYGPLEVEVPVHSRIIWHGIVKHDAIFNIMEDADALLMPFIICPLILSVNPVKLYEYIRSDTPAIAIQYEETKQFNDYVYLYQSFDDYCILLEKLISGKLEKRGTMDSVNEFLQQNTWNERGLVIKKCIDNIIEKNKHKIK